MDPHDADPRRSLLDRLTEPVSPLDALAILRDLARGVETPPPPSPVDGGPVGRPPAGGPPERAAPETGDPTPDGRPNRGNYLGHGLYVFQGAEARKLTAYVDPGVHRALKAAAARRGTTMSEIVDATLRAAGFGDDGTDRIVADEMD